MKTLKFRRLEACEIECRIATINEKGLTLLLYKDARVDQNILDETVGVLNWERKHEVIDGNLYCTVSIYDEGKGAWVSKQDVGTESYTEKEKGQASDSFKRACFNFGIGRELYTAPFIWISADNCKISQKNGKYVCYDKFYVSEITYDDKGRISTLVIKVGNNVVFSSVPKIKQSDAKLATQLQKKTFMNMCEKLDVDYKDILKLAGVQGNMTEEQYGIAMLVLKNIEVER